MTFLPNSDGLPAGRVIAVPLIALLLIFVGLVAFGITGSSTGYVHHFISSGTDERLLAGEPRGIRSDEWFVQTSWTISQVEQGLPIENQSFPGGMDATVQHDLPSSDWSVVFRPHLLGFWFLPLDQAMAFKWWLPGFALIAAMYLFAVTLLPRRPISSAVLAAGFFFAPFFQWWYLSITFLPAAWALIVMTAVAWLLKSKRRAPRIVLPILAGYGALGVGMGIYVPFIVPSTLVAICVSTGMVLSRDFSSLVGLRAKLRSLRFLLIAGIGAALVMAIWLATRWGTIVSFTATVYPGERLAPTGGTTLRDTISILAGVFSRDSVDTGGQPFGPNPSEAATFILTGLFLVIPAIWVIVDRRRRGAPPPGILIATLIAVAIVVLFLYVPGWDALAHLTLLDRSTDGRMRLALGLASVVLIVVMIRNADDRRDSGLARVPAYVASGTVALSVLCYGAIALYLYRQNSILVTQHVDWIAIALLASLALWAIIRGPSWSGVWGFAVASLATGLGVNPVYIGVLNLNDTSLVKAMDRIDTNHGTWIGIGDSGVPTMALVESGLKSLNGFQSAPSKQMWSEIDPSDAYEIQWNRLANVSWQLGTGAPDPRNPYPDQIQMTFDSCASFVQDHVTFVLSEEPIQQSCIQQLQTVTEGPTTFRIYEVVVRN